MSHHSIMESVGVSRLRIADYVGGRSWIFKSYAGSRSRGSSVSIMSDYGLYDRGSIPGRDKGFFL
jgi:hypothetical protein